MLRSDSIVLLLLYFVLLLLYYLTLLLLSLHVRRRLTRSIIIVQSLAIAPDDRRKYARSRCSPKIALWSQYLTFLEHWLLSAWNDKHTRVHTHTHVCARTHIFVERIYNIYISRKYIKIICVMHMYTHYNYIIIIIFK